MSHWRAFDATAVFYIMQSMIRVAAVLALSWTVGPCPLKAQQVPFAPDPLTAGWREINVPGERRNKHAVDASGSLAIESDRAVSFLSTPVPPDVTHPSRLNWRWQVVRDFPPTDLAAKGKDDRPLAVHVWFPSPDAVRSGGLLRGIIAGILGMPEWGRALTYVWGGTAAMGTRLPNPYMDGREGALIVLRPGGTPLSEWFAESVDLAADYRAAFGAEPPLPSFVAVSADTDDTRESSTGFISDLHFTAAPE